MDNPSEKKPKQTDPPADEAAAKEDPQQAVNKERAALAKYLDQWDHQLVEG